MGWLSLARYVVFGIVVSSAGVAVGHWALRTRRLSPFSKLGRWLRRASERTIAPVERRLVRFGGNPQHAEWWFAGGVLFAGVLVLSGTEWAVETVRQSAALVRGGGARGVYVLVISLAYRILVVALIIRVIASWIDLESYARWMRPVRFLTEWLLRPLRAWVPPLGSVIDITPLIAWFALAVAQRILLSIV